MLRSIAIFACHANNDDEKCSITEFHCFDSEVTLPFQILTLDSIGPKEPRSLKGHMHCLCIVDNCIRWPAVYPLKNLGVKYVYDSLLQLFMQFGIPTIITIRNASNFVNRLRQEFETRLVCSSRLNSLSHSEASGVVEPWNASLKSALHHVIPQTSRACHRVIPNIVSAYREVPNAASGVPQFMLVYGRIPKDPLSVLKET